MSTPVQELPTAYKFADPYCLPLTRSARRLAVPYDHRQHPHRRARRPRRSGAGTTGCVQICLSVPSAAYAVGLDMSPPTLAVSFIAVRFPEAVSCAQNRGHFYWHYLIPYNWHYRICRKIPCVESCNRVKCYAESCIDSITSIFWRCRFWENTTVL